MEFLYDAEEKLLLLTGQFLAHLTSEFDCVVIHYSGRLDPHDPPCSDYVFHVSKAHLRSTSPATRFDSRVDFLMERPLGPHCVRRIAPG